MRILIGDVRARLRELPDESVHCVVTSPPYWGLRDYGVEGQLGLERTLGEHLSVMVSEVFAEVHRVLRKDGTCWVNYGDCYATSPNGRSAAATKAAGNDDRTFRDKPFSTIGGVLKPKDLCMIPNRFAIAMQDAGWWVRSEIIWHKPNPMPESIKDRPGTSHEKVFLFSKSERYWYDAEAVKRPTGNEGDKSGNKVRVPGADRIEGASHVGRGFPYEDTTGLANLRNVWTIATAPFSEAHFATFPPDLPEICIKAGTSEKGCCAACGAPWKRLTDVTYSNPGNRTTNGPRSASRKHETAGFAQRLEKNVETLGWEPTCDCGAPITPCVALDPFGGAGTTGLVADRLKRDAILIELNPEYAALAERRIKGDAGMFASVDAA